MLAKVSVSREFLPRVLMEWNCHFFFSPYWCLFPFVIKRIIDTMAVSIVQIFAKQTYMQTLGRVVFLAEIGLQEGATSESSNSLLKGIKGIAIEELQESRTHGFGLLHPLIPQDIQFDGLFFHVRNIHVLCRYSTL